MRVLFTIGTLGGGGAERNVSLLANKFVNNGYEVGIMTIWGDEQVYQLDPRIEYIPLNPTFNNKLDRFLKQVFQIRSKIKKFEPDVVISFLADVNAFVLLRTRLLKCKVIVSERNDPNIDPTIKLFRLLRKLIYPFADGYVFQTEDAREYFYRIANKRNSIVICNPVREDLPIHNEKNNSKIITSACRLTEQKNLPMLINAFAGINKIHPEYQLHIYGEGNMQSELQKYIDEKGLTAKVKLMGFSKDVCSKINESEIFALASNYEGMSNSMLEALAMGMPTVVTDCPIGGARMIIHNGKNGILVPVGDTYAMQLALEKLIENQELRRTLSENALEIRNTNSVDRIIQKWLDFIVNIVGEK